MITTVTFDAKTNLLTIIGEGIQPKQIVIDEPDSWDFVNDLMGEPKYDIQLGYDEGMIKEFGHPYSFQYVNLVPDVSSPLNGTMKQGDDWRSDQQLIIFNYEEETPEVDESGRYEVEVCRIGYAHRTITVKADSPEEAEDTALDMSGEFEFSEGGSEYKVTRISRV